MPGIWTSGGDLNTARSYVGGCGIQSAALAAGGSPSLSSTEEYNGTVWSSGGDLSGARSGLACGGAQDSAFAAGGAGPVVTTEEYNGTVWSSGGDLNTGRGYLAAAGTLAAGLTFGGATASVVTEEYNGTAWSSGGDLILGRHYLGGCGIQSAALSFGGYTGAGSPKDETEEYNGTAWSSGGDLNTGRRGLGGAGTQSSALSFGGYISIYQAVTEDYNGSTWIVRGNLNTARNVIAGCGADNVTAISFGGTTGSYSNVTEEYDYSSSSSSSQSSSSSSKSSSSSSSSKSSSSSSSSLSSSSSSSLSSSSSSRSSSSSSQSISYNIEPQWYDSSDTYELTSLIQVAVEGNITSPVQELHLWANKDQENMGILENVKISVSCMNGSWSGESNSLGQECVDEKWIEMRSDGVVDPNSQGIVDDAEGEYKPIGGGFTLADDYQVLGDMPPNTARVIYIRFNIPSDPDTEGIIYPKLVIQYDVGSSSSSSSSSSKSSSSSSISSSSSSSISSSSSSSISSSSSKSSSSSSSFSSSSSSSYSTESSSSSSSSSKSSSSSSFSSSSSSKSSSSSSSESSSSSSNSSSSSSYSSSSSSKSSSSSSSSSTSQEPQWIWNDGDAGSNWTLDAENAIHTGEDVWNAVRSEKTLPGSGKSYFEILIDNYSWGIMVGVATSSANLDSYVGSDANGWSYSSTGNKYTNGGSSAFGSSYGDNAIIGIAVDEDNGKIWFAKDNVWQGSGDPANGTNEAFSGLSGTLYAMISSYGLNEEMTGQFVSGDQTYSPPSGFSALS